MDNLRPLFTAIILLFFWQGAFSQSSVDHWESVVLPEDNAKYLPGNSAPPANWITSTFNDDNWNDGTCSIGYGDNDDLTVIDQTLSLYVRTDFNIIDASKVLNAVLHMDYDDAFIAWLNGVEIARSNNIGPEGTIPSYDTPASSNHEALMYSGGMPEDFFISEEKLSVALQQGNNVLSIQVHNVTTTSSDMSCIPHLSLGITNQETNYRNTPEWFSAPVGEFTSSNLPILIIDTDGGVGIPDDPKVDAEMKIAFNTEGNINHVLGPYHESSGPVAIETRGNSTQSFPKQPYLFETRNLQGENRNTRHPRPISDYQYIAGLWA
jgi:hypothetical protein